MIFKTLKIKNFLSFGPETQIIDLSNPGMYFITGINKAIKMNGDSEEALSNGSGKSSLIFALSWVLYNQIPKKINVDEIVNEKTQRDCMVELEFEVGNDTYFIERWKRINGKNADKLLFYKGAKDEDHLISAANKTDTQEKINELVQFNFKSFINAIMMTQEQIAGFLETDSTKKKEIIENILQLNILTKYHTIATQKRKIAQKQYEVARSKEENAGTLMDNTKQSMQDYVDSCEKKKTDNYKEIDVLKEKLESLVKIDIVSERNKIDNFKKLDAKKKELETIHASEAGSLSAFQNELQVTQETLEEYQGFIESKTSESFNTDKDQEILDKAIKELSIAVKNLAKCPTCGHDIEQEKFLKWKSSKLESIKKLESDIDSKKKQAEKQTDNIKQWNIKITELTESINSIKSKIKVQKKKLDLITKKSEEIILDDNIMDENELNRLDEIKKDLDTQINDRENKEFVDKNYIDKLMTQLKQYKIDKKNLSIEASKARNRLLMLKWWEDSFSSKKNSMKSWCINNIIGHFNNRIKYYVDKFFFGSVNLQLDQDLNEAVFTKKRTRTYDMYSGGEKARLNLAILFALNDLVKTSTANMNIMFLDEVLSNYLDTIGINQVLDILQDKSKTNAIFVIDHQESFKEFPFFKNITVTKETDEFSRISFI